MDARVKFTAMQGSLFPPPFAPSVEGGAVFSTAGLNPRQYEAATCFEGPVLVIAGAGSGKTRTLVHRTAYLVEQGVAPERILLLTFTRKAAQEMLFRASLLLNETCRRVTGGTFHAVANQLLRRYGRYLGYPPNFTIIDQADAESVINHLISANDLGGQGKTFPGNRKIVEIISKSINKALSLNDLLEGEYIHLCEHAESIALLKDYYQKFKADHGLMDYDDLLVNWKRLLIEEPGVREELAGRFSFIMVDEYQDTNPIQAEIVRLLAWSHENVMAVGDDSQSIYSFRGADFRNIMDFPRIFENTRIIRLEENYRSTQPILDLTNAIIEKAGEKYTKNLFTSIQDGDRPVIFGAGDERAQARYVADRIMEFKRQGKRLQDMAVLFRAAFHSYKLELELNARRIDFEKRGGLRLTESAHIKDVLSYLRVVCNPLDNVSWNRILLHLNKVGLKTAQKIISGLKGKDDQAGALRAYPAGKSYRKGLAELASLLTSLKKPGLPPARCFDLVMNYYQPFFMKLYHDDYPTRAKDLEQVKLLMGDYVDLQAFLDDTSLDPPEPAGETDGRDRLVLSTIHSAKGLEWDAVFIINMVEGRFPSSHAINGAQMEEERRLLYVAATRAKRHLFFTYPARMFTYDRQLIHAKISSFLSELPAGLAASAGGRTRRTRADSARPFPVGRPAAKKGSVDAGAFNSGVRVRHPFFGEGRIKAVEGARTVSVFFDRHGEKTLNLDYARLELL